MLPALFDLFIELLLWTVFVLDEEVSSENFTLDDEAADDDADFVVDLVFDEA